MTIEITAPITIEEITIDAPITIGSEPTAANVAAIIAGAAEKTTPEDTDNLALESGSILKRLSWANLLATAKTYFDTLYLAAGALAAHLAAFTHSDIAHANRAALDSVSGTNTGDQDLSGLQPVPTLNAHPAIPDNVDNEADRTFSAAYPTHTASIGGDCTLIVTDLSTEQSEMSWLLTTTGAAAIALSGPTFVPRTTQTLDALESGKTYPVALKTFDNGASCHIWVGAGVAV
jgi:hypothetical protein